MEEGVIVMRWYGLQDVGGIIEGIKARIAYWGVNKKIIRHSATVHQSAHLLNFSSLPTRFKILLFIYDSK